MRWERANATGTGVAAGRRTATLRAAPQPQRATPLPFRSCEHPGRTMVRTRASASAPPADAPSLAAALQGLLERQPRLGPRLKDQSLPNEQLHSYAAALLSRESEHCEALRAQAAALAAAQPSFKPDQAAAGGAGGAAQVAAAAADLEVSDARGGRF